MIAATYCRKSNEQDATEENRSVTRQAAVCAAVAAARGWTIDPAHIYQDDGISGVEFEQRPGLMRLLNTLKPRPPFTVLLTYDTDRLGREQFESCYLLKQFSVAGVTVIECKGGGAGKDVLLDSPTDRFLVSATSFAETLERDKARQRTTDALVRKARAGHVTGGRVFGFDNVDVRDDQGRRRVERLVNDAEAAVVRRIFALAAEGRGLRAIAVTCNAEGACAPVPRRAGRPRGWAPSSVREVLHRELYRGGSSSGTGRGSAIGGAASSRPRGRRPSGSVRTPRRSASSTRTPGRPRTIASARRGRPTCAGRTASSGADPPQASGSICSPGSPSAGPAGGRSTPRAAVTAASVSTSTRAPATSSAAPRCAAMASWSPWPRLTTACSAPSRTSSSTPR